MEKYLLLFSANYHALAVIKTMDETYSGHSLSVDGERDFVQVFDEWRAQGINLKRIQIDTDGTRRWYEEYIPLTSDKSAQAIKHWCEEHRIFFVELDQTKIKFWKEVSTLTIPLQEKFQLMLFLEKTPLDKLDEWQKLWRQER